jgi:hypothetical protein
MGNITFTQVGQLRPYGDSIYAGTVKAATEQEARDALQKSRGGNRPILDKQAKEFGECFRPYFTLFKEIEPGIWKFSITEIYTD